MEIRGLIAPKRGGFLLSETLPTWRLRRTANGSSVRLLRLRGVDKKYDGHCQKLGGRRLKGHGMVGWVRSKKMFTANAGHSLGCGGRFEREGKEHKGKADSLLRGCGRGVSDVVE